VASAPTYCYGEPGSFPATEFQQDTKSYWIHNTAVQHYAATGVRVKPPTGPTTWVLSVRYPINWRILNVTANSVALSAAGHRVDLKVSGTAQNVGPGEIQVAPGTLSHPHQGHSEMEITYPAEWSHAVDLDTVRMGAQPSDPGAAQPLIEVDLPDEWQYDMSKGRARFHGPSTGGTGRT